MKLSSFQAPRRARLLWAVGLVSLGMVSRAKAAAIVSAVLLTYLGVETFLEVVDASRELKGATDRATTWVELEQAGHRFANRVGPEVARVFVLAVTVVVSHGMPGGAAWLASCLSMLPSFMEASAAGASRVGLLLANVGQVSAVAVEGSTVVISLPATAVAMTAQGLRGAAAGAVLSAPGLGARSAVSRVPWARRARGSSGTTSSSRRRATRGSSVPMLCTTPIT